MSTRVRLPIWRDFRFLLPWLPVLASFLLIEGPILYFEWRAGRRATFRTRPGTAFLFMICVSYATFRVSAFHPIFRKGYRTWLESTPWTYRKPLPLGPVEFAWKDGLFLGLLMLLSATQPEPDALHLLCTYLLVNLLALTCSFWLTRSWEFGYATAFALGLAVLYWRQPLVCVTILAGVYMIAYEGIRQAMASFPWKVRDLPNLSGDISQMSGGRESCGWPHDRMMREIVDDHGIARIDVVLGCMLASWWSFVLISLLRDPRERTICSILALIVAMVIAPIFRIAIYADGYSAPIGFWGRIWKYHGIIPGYDRIFVAPLFALIAGPATVVLLRTCGLPAFVSYVSAAGMVVMVAILTPPRLRRWRLTGQHRIAPAVNLKHHVRVG